MFLDLLTRNGITAVADVRSSPYSRMNPQYNRELLKDTLAGAGISYVFLGEELGARSEDPSCYEGAVVQYDRIAETDLFKQGLARVREGAGLYRVALMCAEKEPLDCHRTILVARQLEASGATIRHILADGTTEPHSIAMQRLRRKLGMSDSDLFKSPAELDSEAYERQAARIAYKAPGDEPTAVGEGGDA